MAFVEDFPYLTDERANEIVRFVINSPMYDVDFFKEEWVQCSRGITPLFKTMGHSFKMPALPGVDDVLINAVVLRSLLEQAENDGAGPISTNHDLIRYVNVNTPSFHLNELLQTIRHPLFVVMPVRSCWNVCDLPILFLVVPQDCVYCLGHRPGLKALKIYYYSYLGLRRKRFNYEVPDSLTRFLQFLCRSLTYRDVCPLTQCRVKEDVFLNDMYKLLLHEAICVSIASKKLLF